MSSKFSKNIGAGIIVLLITVCFMPAMAGAFAPGGGRHDRGMDMKGPHRPALGIWRDLQMIQKLELTKAQVKQLRNLDFEHREKCLALKAKIDGFHLKMDKAFTDDVVENKVVLQLAEKISDIKGKLFVQDIESRLALGKILSADQIEKLKLHVMFQKRHGRKHGMNGNPKFHSVEKAADTALSDKTGE